MRQSDGGEPESEATDGRATLSIGCEQLQWEQSRNMTAKHGADASCYEMAWSSGEVLRHCTEKQGSARAKKRRELIRCASALSGKDARRKVREK